MYCTKALLLFITICSHFPGLLQTKSPNESIDYDDSHGAENRVDREINVIEDPVNGDGDNDESYLSKGKTFYDVPNKIYSKLDPMDVAGISATARPLSPRGKREIGISTSYIPDRNPKSKKSSAPKKMKGNPIISSSKITPVPPYEVILNTMSVLKISKDLSFFDSNITETIHNANYTSSETIETSESDLNNTTHYTNDTSSESLENSKIVVLNATEYIMIDIDNDKVNFTLDNSNSSIPQNSNNTSEHPETDLDNEKQYVNDTTDIVTSETDTPQSVNDISIETFNKSMDDSDYSTENTLKANSKAVDIPNPSQTAKLAKTKIVRKPTLAPKKETVTKAPSKTNNNHHHTHHKINNTKSFKIAKDRERKVETKSVTVDTPKHKLHKSDIIKKDETKIYTHPKKNVIEHESKIVHIPFINNNMTKIKYNEKILKEKLEDNENKDLNTTTPASIKTNAEEVSLPEKKLNKSIEKLLLEQLNIIPKNNLSNISQNVIKTLQETVNMLLKNLNNPASNSNDKKPETDEIVKNNFNKNAENLIKTESEDVTIPENIQNKDPQNMTESIKDTVDIQLHHLNDILQSINDNDGNEHELAAKAEDVVIPVESTINPIDDKLMPVEIIEITDNNLNNSVQNMSIGNVELFENNKNGSTQNMIADNFDIVEITSHCMNITAQNMDDIDAENVKIPKNDTHKKEQRAIEMTTVETLNSNSNNTKRNKVNTKIPKITKNKILQNRIITRSKTIDIPDNIDINTSMKQAAKEKSKIVKIIQKKLKNKSLQNIKKEKPKIVTIFQKKLKNTNVQNVKKEKQKAVKIFNIIPKNKGTQNAKKEIPKVVKLFNKNLKLSVQNANKEKFKAVKFNDRNLNKSKQIMEKAKPETDKYFDKKLDESELNAIEINSETDEFSDKKLKSVDQEILATEPIFVDSLEINIADTAEDVLETKAETKIISKRHSHHHKKHIVRAKAAKNVHIATANVDSTTQTIIDTKEDIITTTSKDINNIDSNIKESILSINNNMIQFDKTESDIDDDEIHLVNDTIFKNVFKLKNETDPKELKCTYDDFYKVLAKLSISRKDKNILETLFGLNTTNYNDEVKNLEPLETKQVNHTAAIVPFPITVINATVNQKHKNTKLGRKHNNRRNITQNMQPILSSLMLLEKENASEPEEWTFLFDSPSENNMSIEFIHLDPIGNHNDLKTTEATTKPDIQEPTAATEFSGWAFFADSLVVNPLENHNQQTNINSSLNDSLIDDPTYKEKIDSEEAIVPQYIDEEPSVEDDTVEWPFMIGISPDIHTVKQNYEVETSQISTKEETMVKMHPESEVKTILSVSDPITLLNLELGHQKQQVTPIIY